MIKKLQIKIVFLLMCIMTVFICCFSVISYHSTQQTFEGNCESVLNNALYYGSAGGTIIRRNTIYPLLIVSSDYKKDYQVLLNNMTNLSNEDITNLIEHALSSSKKSALIDNTFRYLRKSVGYSDIRIAFADISTEQAILKQQLAQTISVSVIVWLAFFLTSIFLSRKLVIPIKNTFYMQECFISNASHELKTPLTVILSNSEMLTSNAFASTEEQKQTRIGLIKKEALRMKKLIEDMLQLAKYDSLLKGQKFEKINFSYIVNTCLLTYEPLIYDQGKNLQTKIHDNLFINGDSEALTHLINILLDNAIKYSTEKSEISAESSITPAKKVIFSISNYGIPISPDNAPKIFQRFYRLKSDAQGYGLGLSIALTIATNMNGRIWVESDGKAKNTFYIQFDGT